MLTRSRGVPRWASIAVIFVLLSLGAGDAAEKESPKPRFKLPLEKQDDPPIFVWRTESSPRMISAFGPYTSYQVNVDGTGQNIVGDAGNEPSICVDPTNPNRMAVGWRQFNSVASNFRQSGWGYTSNGGSTWTFPGVLENNVFRSDPVLGADSTGSFFYLSLLQTFFDDMWRSLNGGMSWTRLAAARGGDKQWFTIDNTNSTGHGFQYQAWSTDGNNYNGRQFTRSVDGGLTWINPVNIPNSPTWGTLDVDTSGNLFIGGVNQTTSQVWCERSSNAKNSAVTPSFDQSTAVNLGGAVGVEAPINPLGLIGQIFVAVDRSGTATNNNVYMLCSVQPTGFTTGSDVMFVRSTNAGQTFSAPLRVNDDPVDHNKWHWFGALSVAPNGRLDVVWLDSRNAANNTDSQLFYAYSTNGGISWSPNVPVSTSFNPFLGYPNQNKMGDYMTLVSDNAGANVAYCATFNQEQDIYYIRVAPIPPAVQSAVSRKTHGPVGNFDIALPLTGTRGIECRNGGANGDHRIVITFASPITIAGNPQASITTGTGSVSNVNVTGAVATVDLTGVTNAQTIALTLKTVSDGVSTGDVVIPIDVLAGDTTVDRSVNSADISQAKSQSGQAVDNSNFRTDVNFDGTLNSADISLVKSRSGTALP